MTPDELRARVAGLLLHEMRTGKPQWYYLSVAAEKFYGGYFIEARGPTEAWSLLHQLGWCPKDHETLTVGPIHARKMDRVPEDMRWRRLTKEELMAFDTLITPEKK